MSRIKHPRFQPGRSRSLGIEFVDGYAEVDLADKPNLSAALIQHGYSIEETLTVDGDLSGLLEASDASGDILDLETLTVPQLRSLARIRSVDVPKRATKADLIDLISRQPAEPVQFAVVELPDGTIIGDGKSIATLHEWIVPLEPDEE